MKNFLSSSEAGESHDEEKARQVFRGSVTSRHNPERSWTIAQESRFTDNYFAYVARYVKKDTRKATYDQCVADFKESELADARNRFNAIRDNPEMTIL